MVNRITLPPRHARGCPQNVVRAVLWQLSTSDLTPDELDAVITKIKDILPCKCPLGKT